MHALKTTALCAAAVIGLTGCEGENLFANADVVVGADSNTFRAVVFDIENQAGERIDLIAEGGRFELSLDDEAGAFESSFQFRGNSFRTSGTFEVAEGRITFSDDPLQDDDRELQRSFDFDRTEDVILMEDSGALFDVNDDGTREVATVRIRLEPRD